MISSPLILDSLAQPSFIINSKGECIFFNVSAATLLQLDQTMHVGHALNDLLSGLVENSILVQINGAIRSREPKSFEFNCSLKSGLTRWYEINVSPTVEEGNTLIVLHDVSRFRETEAKFVRCHQILEKAEWGIAIGSADGKTLEMVNPAYARMHGYTVEELTGAPIHTVYPDDAHAHLAVDIEENHRVGHRSQEMRHRHRDGHLFTVLSDVTTVKDADGCVEYMIVNVQDITEQVKAREELRIRKEFFQRTFDDAAVGMAIADLDGRYLSANAAMCEMVGYSEEELKKMTYRDITHPDDVGENDRQRDLLLENRIEKFSMEKRYVRKDGSVIWALMVVSVIHGSDGNALVSVGQMLSIDEFKRAEQAVRESEANLNVAQHQAGVGSWVLDLKSNKLHWSDQIYRLFELDPVIFQCSYEAFLDAVHADDRSAVDKAYSNSLKTRLPYEITHRLQMKDGRIKWVTEKCATEYDGDGNPIRSVGTVQDVTQLKQTELALQESYQLLERIINTAPVRVFWKDRNLRFLGCNEAFAKDAGKSSPADMIGKDDFQMSWQEQAEGYRADDLHVIETGIPKLGYEEPQKTAGGRLVWLSTSKVPLRNKHNEVVGILGIYEDITLRKKAEREVIRSREHIRALAAYHERILEQERHRIAREIHDELGQQLTGLKFDINTLRQRNSGNEEIERATQMMGDTINKSIAMIRQIASDLRPAALDLGILAAVEWLANKFTERWGIECAVDYGGNEFLLSDTQEIVVFRVAQESLTNIARHAKAKKVMIRLCSAHDSMMLEIQDDGIGFDMRSAAARDGYGLLGMRERSLTLGGTLEIESEPGKGTSVRLTYPLES